MNLCNNFILSDDLEEGIIIKENDEYKQIWTCWIKNKESNDTILLLEWKGTSYIGIENQFMNIDELPKNFSNDILELLNYLLSDQCVHPYDNLVAGTHA
jgi:hypothetical protein